MTSFFTVLQKEKAERKNVLLDILSIFIR